MVGSGLSKGATGLACRGDGAPTHAHASATEGASHCVSLRCCCPAEGASFLVFEVLPLPPEGLLSAGYALIVGHLLKTRDGLLALPDSVDVLLKALLAPRA